VSRYLERLGHEVLVAKARQVRIIYDNDRKTDKSDARTLARLAHVDQSLLHPIRHRCAEAQADLTILSVRDQLISVRTAVINCVRGMVKSMGSAAGKLAFGHLAPRSVLCSMPTLYARASGRAFIRRSRLLASRRFMSR